MRVHKASLALAALIAAPIALETAVALSPGPSGAPTDLNEPNDSVVWVDGRTRKEARQASSTGEQSEFFVSGRRSTYRVNPNSGAPSIGGRSGQGELNPGGGSITFGGTIFSRDTSAVTLPSNRRSGSGPFTTILTGGRDMRGVPSMGRGMRGGGRMNRGMRSGMGRR